MLDDFQLPKIRDFDDLFPYPTYKTGIYDKDKAPYVYSLDKTENPNMTCPYILRSGENSLDPGYYEVALSDDKRYLLLIQSRELKALVPAVKVVVQKDTTVTKTPFGQYGNGKIIMISIVIVSGIGFIVYRKFKKVKFIK